MEIAARARSLRPFLAMEVFERAQALERAGADILHLEVGEPDFEPPRAARDGVVAAIDAGHTRYTDSRGLHELREAIADDKARRSGVSVDPDCVLVTSGTSPALLLVFSLLLEPGDEVVIPAPHYPCYPNFARFCGATPVAVSSRPQDGWRIDPRAVEAALTPRTRAIVIGSPANPTGAVQSAETLAALANLGVPLICDEIYDGLVYGQDAAPSALAALGPGGAGASGGAVFALDGFSKRYAMTGYRLGYVVAPKPAARALQIAHQNLAISAGDFVQRAGLAVLRAGGDEVAAMREAYRERRDLLVTGLRALGFGVPVAPDGAFYVFADARAFGDDSVALSNTLLDEASVAVTPGVDFGDSGEGFLRLSYATRPETLADALERMAPVLERLRV